MAEFELEEVQVYVGRVDRRYSAILARALNDRIAAD